MLKDLSYQIYKYYSPLTKDQVVIIIKIPLTKDQIVLIIKI